MQASLLRPHSYSHTSTAILEFQRHLISKAITKHTIEHSRISKIRERLQKQARPRSSSCTHVQLSRSGFGDWRQSHLSEQMYSSNSNVWFSPTPQKPYSRIARQTPWQSQIWNQTKKREGKSSAEKSEALRQSMRYEIARPICFSSPHSTQCIKSEDSGCWWKCIHGSRSCKCVTCKSGDDWADQISIRGFYCTSTFFQSWVESFRELELLNPRKAILYWSDQLLAAGHDDIRWSQWLRWCIERSASLCLHSRYISVDVAFSCDRNTSLEVRCKAWFVDKASGTPAFYPAPAMRM